MVIPLYDTDPLESDRTPWLTYALMAINTLLFLLVFAASFYWNVQWADIFALVPEALWRGFNKDGSIAATLTLVSYLFFHHGWVHLTMNMLFLWIFGDNIEDAFGRVRYLIFFLLCGASGGLAHAIQMPNSTAPLVGASAAIAGIVAAYALLRPCAKIEVVIIVFPVAIDAYLIIGAWFLLQITHLWDDAQSGPAWAAHVGGFLAGAMLTIVMRPPHLKLFDCVHPSARTAARIAARTRHVP